MHLEHQLSPNICGTPPFWNQLPEKPSGFTGKELVNVWYLLAPLPHPPLPSLVLTTTVL